MFQGSINSIQNHLSYCLKTKHKRNSRGDNFDNTRNRGIISAFCSTLHIHHYSINVPSINRFHSETSELLLENKTLTKFKGR